MTILNHHRRGFLRGAGAAALALALGAAEARSHTPLTIGFVYAGAREDFGYNQSHALAARAAAALPGVTVEEVEAEPGGVPAAAGALAAPAACRLVFVTAADPELSSLLAQADANRETVFMLCGAVEDEARLPANVGTYDAYIDEAQHVAGIVAGYASPGHRLGFVATRGARDSLRSVNAFALGARRADASTTMQVVFVEPAASGETVAAAAKALVAGGADVLAGFLPSLRPVCEVAEAAGVFCCGLHTDLSALAPTALLTGAEWDWGRACSAVIHAVQQGQPRPRVQRGGFGAGLVRMTPYGPAVSAEARAHAEAARFQLANGNASVFRGPVLDNTGRTVVPKGKAMASDDPRLDSLVWLVDGVGELEL